MVKNLSLKVILKEKLSTKVYRIRFGLEEDVDFVPGQFMSIVVAPGQRRSYSISNLPGEGYVETLVDVSPGGVGSKFFENIEIGQESSMMLPLGRFVYIEGDERSSHFFSTGTGIAPFVSMIRHALEREGNTKEVVLHQGVRYEDEIFLDEELTSLSERYPNFKYSLYVSQPKGDWQGNVGRINQFVLEQYSPDSKCDVYICGGTEMIKDTESKLIEAGVSQDRIFYERYY